MMNEIELSNNQSETTLETALLLISKYAKPYLWQNDKGKWYCKAEMRVTGQGISFEVASDYTCNTPTEAARQCLSRIADTLQKYGVKV